MIFIAQKRAEEGAAAPTLFTEPKSLAAPYPHINLLIRTQGARLPQSAIAGPDWALTDKTSASRIETMRKNGIPLGEYVNGQIYRGILTGFNQAFIIDGAKRAELIAEDPKSEEIIKPFAVGKDIRRWRIEHKDRWLIKTGIGVDMKRYPAIFKHLSRWQPELEKRYDKGKHWWELRACAYYDAFEKPKILYPVMVQFPRFAIDREHFYTNDKGFIISTDETWLVGLLNSSIAWQYLKSICSPLQGDTYEMRAIYVSQIPIPRCQRIDQSKVAALVEQMIANPTSGEQLEHEIDERITRLYGLEPRSPEVHA